MAKHRTVAPGDAGSSPVLPTNSGHVSEWIKEADCKPVARWFSIRVSARMTPGSCAVKAAVWRREAGMRLDSSIIQLCSPYGTVAQLVERPVEAREAAGSSPAVTTKTTGSDHHGI